MRVILIFVMLLLFAVPLSAMPEPMGQMTHAHCSADNQTEMSTPSHHSISCGVCAGCAIVLIPSVRLDYALGRFVDLPFLNLSKRWAQRFIEHPLRPPIL
jgi:hypothetical protein